MKCREYFGIFIHKKIHFIFLSKLNEIFHISELHKDGHFSDTNSSDSMHVSQLIDLIS